MPLQTKTSLTVAGLLTSTPDLAAARVDFSKVYAAELANGVAAGQADKIWADTNTLAASANVDLDLAGVLLDVFGQAIAFARIKAIILSALAGNTNNVVLGGAATNTFVGPFGAATHTLAVRPGATLALFAGAGDATGYPVTAGTGDLLRVANGGAGSTVTYDIMIIGASA